MDVIFGLVLRPLQAFCVHALLPCIITVEHCLYDSRWLHIKSLWFHRSLCCALSINCDVMALFFCGNILSGAFWLRSKSCLYCQKAINVLKNMMIADIELIQLIPLVNVQCFGVATDHLDHWNTKGTVNDTYQISIKLEHSPINGTWSIKVWLGENQRTNQPSTNHAT